MDGVLLVKGGNMAACYNPNCKVDVIYTAFQNHRTGTWIILPLEKGENEGDFEILQRTHETVDIMKQPAGEFPVSEELDGIGIGPEFYRTHRPSHFLGDVHEQ